MSTTITPNESEKSFTLSHGKGLTSEIHLGAMPKSWMMELGLTPVQSATTIAITSTNGPVSTNLLYEALCWARTQGAKAVIHHAKNSDDPVAMVMKARPVRKVSGPNASVFVAAALSDALQNVFERGDATDQASMRATFRPQIEATMKLFVERFFTGAWATAIQQKKLSREQYVLTLNSLHHYVRYTTRLLGQAVAISPTSELRSHFAEHLRGEINHELIIERDLKHMGEDPTFLMTKRYPNAATRGFMVVQQSLAVFERDPVLFMACPLAAEGISAHLDKRFLQALRECVGSYGVDAPEKATMFFSSHIMTDGGDDGHWESTLKILEHHLQTENKLGEFLSLLELASSSIEQSFNANVSELAIFNI